MGLGIGSGIGRGPAHVGVKGGGEIESGVEAPFHADDRSPTDVLASPGTFPSLWWLDPQEP